MLKKASSFGSLWRRGTAVLVAASLPLLIAGSLFQPVDAIARGYTSADTGLKIGMVAALTSNKESESQVERATQENTQQVVGVVSSVDDSLVTVASGSAKVLVESEGETAAYVSDMGGAVTKGSLLAISPVKGVLMKASETSGKSIVAVASQDATAKGDSTAYDVEESGVKKSVQIARITVNLNRTGGAQGGTTADSSLAKLGKAIVGKQVSEIRVVVALLLFLVVLIAEGAIIYGAVSSAIIALGRNPLARTTIRNEMLRIILVALAVFLIGLGAIYGILWV